MNNKEEKQHDLNSSFQTKQPNLIARDVTLGFGERAFSAAGAAVLSAVLVNPLDVAKVYSLISPPPLYFYVLIFTWFWVFSCLILYVSIVDIFFVYFIYI